MLRLLLIPAVLLTASCAWQTMPLHDVHVDLKKGEWAWCLAPSGQVVGWAG